MSGSKRQFKLSPLVLVCFAISSTMYPAAQKEAGNIAYVHTLDQKAREDYLARAVIWRDPGVKTPEEILQGPPGRFPLSQEAVDAPEGFPCTFNHVGRSLGGKTKKFICETPDGQTVRFKYYDGPGGNREIFGSVASTRLLWALGFDADAVYPVKVNCLDCPENPWTGSGKRASRTFAATLEPHYEGTLILSGTDPQEGWTWAQVDKAIEKLPRGELYNRQRMHFDALALLGVLIQHGDRKPSQQRLVCRGDISREAGDLHSVSPDENASWRMPVLFERSGMQSCSEPAATVQDVGATYGSAGAFTIAHFSKMNLQQWVAKSVFRDSSENLECEGNLDVSLSAGTEGEGSPHISEQGRAFLAQQLNRLTEDHLRALFTAARVELLGDENHFRDSETGQKLTGVDAWIAVFQKKIREIDGKRCETFEC